MKKTYLIKTKKALLLIFILIFCFSFIFEITSFFIEKADSEQENNLIDLHGSMLFNYEWNRTWGTMTNDEARGIAVDSADNIYVTGHTEASSDMILVKYDSSGMMKWDKTYSNSEGAYSIVVDSSDCLYIAGYKISNWVDIFLGKYNNDGTEQWSRTWGGDDQDYAFGITVDSIGNVYVVGTTKSFGASNFDVVIIKYNNDGIEQWSLTWGGWSIDWGTAIQVDPSGNIYVAGHTFSFGLGRYDMFLKKYDNNGVELWNRTWGGINDDYAEDLVLDSSGNIYLIGATNSFGTNTDMALVKYDTDGVQQWNRTWGGNDVDYGNGLILDSSDDLYVVGYTRSYGLGNADIYIANFDKQGLLKWNRTWGGINNDYAYGVSIDSLDDIYFTGATNSFGVGEFDILTVKFGLDTDDPEITINYPSQGEKFGDDALNYDISIVEPNLESIWYTIDNGLTNFSIIHETGIINQTAWDACSYGSIIIEFWAKDLAGNIGHSEVIVEKVELNGPNRTIPSELIIIVSAIGSGAVLGIAIILLMRKRRKTT